MIVLDCSAVVRIALRVDAGSRLRKLLAEEDMVISSSLLYPELCSAMRKYVKADILTRADAANRIECALALVDSFHGFSEFVQEAFNESIHLDHSPYDIFYLVLARRFGATLVTADRRLALLCDRVAVDCINLLEEAA